MKRTLLLCVLTVALAVAFILPAYAAVEIYQVSVPSGGVAPAFIKYTLNCPATVTVKIYPVGNPVPVRTDNLPPQAGAKARGKYTYVWPCVDNFNVIVPPGNYYGQVIASANQAQWDAIIGLFTMEDVDTEYPARPLPGVVTDMDGFYSVAVNTNPSSFYYGRIYATHKTNKEVYMYDPDGTFLGAMYDVGIPWDSSAPWDISVTSDDYVWVGDRSLFTFYRMNADGLGWYGPDPRVIAPYWRAQFARKDPSTNTVYVIGSGDTSEKENRVTAANVWYNKRDTYTVGNDNYAESASTYGMWVSPDRSTLYQCKFLYTGPPADPTPNDGVTKWTLINDPADPYPGPLDHHYSRTGWVNPRTMTIDVEQNATNDPGSGDPFLWVTRTVATSTAQRAIVKINANTGATIASDYDIITWGHMCSADAVGNIAITFGKSTPTWGQRYWGLFAEPGASSAQKDTTGFSVPADPAPVIVPGSDVWTFSDPNYPGKLFPNGAATAGVTFEAIDANGWFDILDVQLNLSSLGGLPAQSVGSIKCKIDNNTTCTDPTHLYAVCTLAGITAVSGTKCATHNIAVTAYDDHAPGQNSDTFQLPVAGNRMSGTVKHKGSLTPIQNAEIVAWGGKVGAPGYKFTYRSPLTSITGVAEMDISEGTYDVWAEKVGYKSDPVKVVIVPAPSSPPGAAVAAGTLYLGPNSVGEVRALPNGTFVTLEGVCFAQPRGFAPPAAVYGLDERIDLLTKCGQFYICDPNEPQDGMLCLVEKGAGEPLQWDDPDAVDFLGNSTYFGKRPAVGETIMMRGFLDTPGNYERRVRLMQTEIVADSGNNYLNVYVNRGDLGGLPANQITFTVPQFAHVYTTGFHTAWGQFGRVENALVVRQMADGKWFGGTDEGELIPYAVISDAANNWASVTVNTPSSLNMTLPDTGYYYTFIGAMGRRARSGEGTIRPRSMDDMIKGASVPAAAANSVHTIRGVGTGQVNVRGIVTLKGGNYMYIENANRWSGVRVSVAPYYVNSGDEVQVIGGVGIIDGEKRIGPTAPVIIRSTGNTLPTAFDLRSREVGGDAYGVNDPGVTDGRGALNVGLRVRLQGMVTYRDASATPTYFYIWDGATKISGSAPVPLDDGSGHLGVRILHSGYIDPAGVVAWTDWVSVTGVVSATDQVVVGPPVKVIPQIIPIATPTRVTAFDTVTAAAGTALRANWNLFALPAAPAATGTGVPPEQYVYEAPWEAQKILAQDYWTIDGIVKRQENWNQGLYNFDAAQAPLESWFGGMLLGDGYWVDLSLQSAWAVSYSGKASALDQWYGIKSGGTQLAPKWILCGHPKDHYTYWDDATMHDGARIVTMEEASIRPGMLGWIDTSGLWYDNVTKGLKDIGVTEDYPTTQTLLPWHGYWFKVFSPGKSIIFPESPEAPPPP